MLTTATNATIQISATNTTPANNLVAGSASVNRYIRSIHAVNTSASAVTINVLIGTAAIITAANANIAFGLSIPANSNTAVAFFGGRGFRANAASSANAICAFASTTNVVNLVIVYEEDSLTI